MKERKRVKLTIERICDICQDVLPAGMTAYEVVNPSGKVTYEHYGKCKGVQRQDDIIKLSSRIRELEAENLRHIKANNEVAHLNADLQERIYELEQSQTNFMVNAFNLIHSERERQNKKWGEQNHDDYRWLTILSEEVGEIAQAILHDEFGGSHAGTAKIELIQIAAVAVQWLECMERREKS